MIVTGFISLAILLPIYFYKNNSIPPSQQPKTNFLATENAVSPARIIVAETGIDVPVKEAPNYSFSDSQAIFIDTSQKIGEGNSIIYAHNWNNLFGKLGKVKMGDIVSVFLTDGREVKYKINQKHLVSPQTLGILKPTADSQLTLFTCIGFLDKDRLVVVAKQI
jgi:LPXTG-site transpeptidase (sortase) family protein